MKKRCPYDRNRKHRPYGLPLGKTYVWCPTCKTEHYANPEFKISKKNERRKSKEDIKNVND